MLRSVHRSACFAVRVSVLNRGQTGIRQQRHPGGRMRGICFCSRAARGECNLLIASAAKRGHQAESYTARQSMLTCSLISISPAVFYITYLILRTQLIRRGAARR